MHSRTAGKTTSRAGTRSDGWTRDRAAWDVARRLARSAPRDLPPDEVRVGIVVGKPAVSRASSSAIFSLTVREFASELVPNIAKSHLLLQQPPAVLMQRDRDGALSDPG